MVPYTEDVREQELTRLMAQYGDSVKRLCTVYLRDLVMNSTLTISQSG